jgi:hypothetical protein
MLKGRRNTQPVSLRSLGLSFLRTVLTDPLIIISAVYVISSLSLRIGGMLLQTRFESLISDTSGLVTAGLLVVGGLVIARRLLK